MKAHLLDPKIPACILGEGVYWDSQDSCLFWVDINGHAIHRYDPKSARHEQCEVPNSVSFAIPGRKGELVIGLRDHLARIQFNSSSSRSIAPADMPSGNRFNDGKCDTYGRLWAGTMMLDKDQSQPTGILYRYDERGLIEIETGLITANGKGWSPDGKIMYHTDTGTRTIYAYDYDIATGTPSNRRAFITLTGDGSPDGLCVDKKGRLYIALWGGGAVTVYTPDGKPHDRIELPVPLVSCCCFGGPDGKTLFITTAKDGMDDAALAAAPLSGQVFTASCKTAGLPDHRFGF